MGPDRRLAPRPLGLHLGLAMQTWFGWRAGWPPWNGGWPAWPAAAAGDSDALARALDTEGRRRLTAFLDGLDAYRRHPDRRDLPPVPVAAAEGTTRILDFGGTGPTVLLVPSLINRAYILDLSRRRSLARWLAARGLGVRLVDWGAPGPVERGFGLADYVARLERLTADLGSVAVVGYCMGGLLAMALAVRAPDRVRRLALLATPWDFHAAEAPRARALGALAPWLGLADPVPVDVLQALFATVDPFGAVRKYAAFGRLDPRSPAARAFVALEDWLNDGVPLAGPVARECLAGWYGANHPGQGCWHCGPVIVPGAVRCPTLVVVPGRDRIVPPASAAAVAGGLTDVQVRTPPLGHIGMIAGRGAVVRVWGPLKRWLIGSP